MKSPKFSTEWEDALCAMVDYASMCRGQALIFPESAQCISASDLGIERFDELEVCLHGTAQDDFHDASLKLLSQLSSPRTDNLQAQAQSGS